MHNVAGSTDACDQAWEQLRCEGLKYSLFIEVVDVETLCSDQIALEQTVL